MVMLDYTGTFAVYFLPMPFLNSLTLINELRMYLYNLALTYEAKLKTISLESQLIVSHD